MTPPHPTHHTHPHLARHVLGGIACAPGRLTTPVNYKERPAGKSVTAGSALVPGSSGGSHGASVQGHVAPPHARPRHEGPASPPCSLARAPCYAHSSSSSTARGPPHLLNGAHPRPL